MPLKYSGRRFSKANAQSAAGGGASATGTEIASATALGGAARRQQPRAVLQCDDRAPLDARRPTELLCTPPRQLSIPHLMGIPADRYHRDA